MDNIDKIEEVRKRINEIHLVISRVPRETKKQFIELANAMFCGDYGWTLQAILEEYKKSEVYNYLASKLFELEQKINQLTPNTQSAEIKLLGGKIIKTKGGNNE